MVLHHNDKDNLSQIVKAAAQILSEPDYLGVVSLHLASELDKQRGPLMSNRICYMRKQQYIDFGIRNK